MSWYRHPLFWLGVVGAAGYVLLRKRRDSTNFGALPPRGGIVLPPGLLSRRLPASSTAPSEDVEEPPDAEIEPPDEDDLPPQESIPPPSEEPPDWEPPEFEPARPETPRSAECEIVPSTTARLQAKKHKTIIDWNNPDFATTHLCHEPLRQQYLTPPVAAKDPNRFCNVFCGDVGWKSGVCIDDKCVCTNTLLGKR